MEKVMLAYRRKTRRPLLTTALRMIPSRVLEDNDANLVRSIVVRTRRLLEVAEKIWPIVQDDTHSSTSSGEKFTRISQLLRDVKGIGDTWAKMLMVCVDLAYPHLGLLRSQCEIGNGALVPLRCLLGSSGPTDPKAALVQLTQTFNQSQSTSSKHFWSYLPQVEELARQKHQRLPLILEQVKTQPGAVNAVTLQVQLCEYRQFRHSFARLQYGLPHDPSMIEEEIRKPEPEDFMKLDKDFVTFELPRDGEKIPFRVSVRAATSVLVAKRVALICFMKMRDGGSKAEAEALCDELLDGYVGGEDVPADSPAWHICRIRLGHSNPLVAWRYETKSGGSFAFQTTKAAAGGFLQAERIARLCWERLNAGESHEAVQRYRNRLYKESKEGVCRPHNDSCHPQVHEASRPERIRHVSDASCASAESPASGCRPQVQSCPPPKRLRVK